MIDFLLDFVFVLGALFVLAAAVCALLKVRRDIRARGGGSPPMTPKDPTRPPNVE